MKNLEGKWAVITGCNRGIGHAILEKFAEEGANVIACIRNAAESVVEDFKNISIKYGNKISIVSMDLADEESVKSGLKEIIGLKVPIHILVNNAGVCEYPGLMKVKPDSLKHTFQVNYFSPVLITQYLLKPMMKAKGASVINMGSIAGIDGSVGNTVYGASKASLMYATKCWAKELASIHIRVNAIAPGIISTDMTKDMDPEMLTGTFGSPTHFRVGDPKEIASLAAFLASDESSYVTGQVIRADGGI